MSKFKKYAARHCNFILTFCLLINFSLFAQANDLDKSQSLNEKDIITESNLLTLNKSDFQLVGEAQFSVMFWDIYQSRLYTKSGSFSDINSSVIFENFYQKDISKDQLVEKTIEQWQKMQIAEDYYYQYIPQLLNLWPDIKSGDSLAVKVGEESSYFYYNEQYIGVIADKNFAQLFLGIWLAPNTTHPAFRKKLLGDKS